MNSAIQIVALGARTPLGSNAETSAAALRARINRIALHPFMADHDNKNLNGAFDSTFDPGILGRERLAGLAKSALNEVAHKLLSTLPASARVSVLVGLPEARPGFDEGDAKHVLGELQAATLAWGRAVRVEGFGRGHAGGLHALVEAARRAGDTGHDVVIAGGVDSYFDFDTIDWLQEHRQLMNARSRGGFAPGEAAGFVALASQSSCRKLRLSTLAEVRGSGISHETKLIKTEDINLGEGLAQAVQSAVAGLKLPDEAADIIYCDINGERYRIEEWGMALLRVARAVRDTFSNAPAEFWGDVGAASGPLFCNLAAQAWARGYARGPRALLWAGSEGGLRAAVLLEAARA